MRDLVIFENFEKGRARRVAEHWVGRRANETHTTRIGVGEFEGLMAQRQAFTRIDGAGEPFVAVRKIVKKLLRWERPQLAHVIPGVDDLPDPMAAGHVASRGSQTMASTFFSPGSLLWSSTSRTPTMAWRAVALRSRSRAA